MAKTLPKTNAMRQLERANIPYEPIYYQISDEEFSGTAVANLLGLPPEQCFKTLCARGEKKGVMVFVVPVGAELSLKAAAQAAGDKRVELTHQKELLALTGYVRGGVSPVGMKKLYPTFIHESALQFEKISISAGSKGVSLLADPKALGAFLHAAFVPITME